MIKKLIAVTILCIVLSGCQSADKATGSFELSANEVIEKLQDADDTFLLYVTTKDCYSCDEYAAVVDELQKIKPFKIYYLVLNTRENDGDVKKALDELEVMTGDYRSLPTTFYFLEGNLQPENVKEGYIEKEDYIKWLKNLRIF